MQQPEDSPGWAGNPNYVVYFDRIPAKVAAIFNGETVAESDEAHVMLELGHAPVYYFPRASLNQRLFEPSDHDSFCPYKGVASYWSLKVGDRGSENAVWSYENPYPQLGQIKDFIGFYWGRMDRWTEDGETVAGPREIPGRIDTTLQLKAQFSALARQWHPSRNSGIKPYEFPADSDTVVWWQDEGGREWQEPIRTRVLALTRLRGDGDATPYG